MDRLLGWAYLFDSMSVTESKRGKAGHLSYCSWSVYVSLEDTLL